MDEFKKFGLGCKEEIENHVLRLDYKDHNLSFTNMYLWRELFKLEEYISDDFILILCDLDGKIFSLNPIATLDNIPKAVDFLIGYFESKNIPFRIHNCVRKVQEVIYEKYGDYFNYELDRDSYDYLYSIDKIKGYSGKKLQKKRNHVNNFLKEYEGRYKFVPITSKDEKIISDCIAMTHQWASTKDTSDYYLPTEVAGTIDVLENFDKLSCEGLACYIDGKIAAFSFGTQLNNETAVLNVEKADGDIVGLFPFLRQNLVNTYFDDLKYLNTEDDVGEEGLRKSKLSYKPEYLVEKYIITRKDQYSLVDHIQNQESDGDITGIDNEE